jgi:hypothetical protein
VSFSAYNNPVPVSNLVINNNSTSSCVNSKKKNKVQITAERVRKKVSRSIFRSSSPTTGFFKPSTIFDPRFASFRFGFYRTPNNLSKLQLGAKTAGLALPSNEAAITPKFVKIVRDMIFSKVCVM